MAAQEPPTQEELALPAYLRPRTVGCKGKQARVPQICCYLYMSHITSLQPPFLSFYIPLSVLGMTHLASWQGTTLITPPAVRPF